MRIAFTILAGMLIAAGVVWALQSFDFLPDNFMNGYLRWGWRGPAAGAAGLLLLVVVNRGNH
jgi:hypothetical protein